MKASLIGRGIIWNSGGTIFISCQIPQGEYYNADEVQAMVAAEMLEEKRKKQEEEDMFDDIGAEAGQVERIFLSQVKNVITFQAGLGKKKKRVPVIAD